MKLSREIKVALLVLTSILIFIWGYSFLKGKDLFSTYVSYYVVYDNVEGLSTSSPVTLNGLKIGKISAITIGADGKLLVEAQIKTDFPISKNSSLQIYEPGFIGGKQIALVPDYEDTRMAETGDTLKSKVRLGMLAKVGDQLAPMQTKVESTIVSADSLLTNFNSLMTQKNKDNVSIAIEELTQTLKTLNKATGTMNTMLTNNQQNIDGIMSELNKTTTNFSKISGSLAETDLKGTMQNIEKTMANLDKIMSELDAGKGTAGKLIKDEQLYTNITKASKELELLLQDLRLNPTRYINVSVFGKKNKPYKAPVEE
ncbi:MAG TPA: MlaD family protein [Flavobacterium sp.]|nr:MlaD family protein [Flavobacterium sp.]